MAKLESKSQLKKKYKDEQVYIVPFDKVESIPDKFTRIKDQKNIWSNFDNVGKYIYRYDAEGEPSFQQIIPYILIKNPKNNKFYTTERLQGDVRLNGVLSAAVGGHIDSEDGYEDVIFKGALRELNEEMHIDIIGEPEFIGYVRDLSSVTNDHLGVVLLVESNSTCKVKEIHKMKGQWMSYEELESNYSKFESWAKHVIDYMCGNKGKL